MLTSKSDVQNIVSGVHNNPFSILGLHFVNKNWVIRAFIPNADKIDVIDTKTGELITSLTVSKHSADFFEAKIKTADKRFAYRLNIHQGNHSWIADDPYRFGPVIGEIDEYLLGEGTHKNLWQILGAHTRMHEGVWGTHFAIWAPNAKRVSVVGDFNAWDGRRHVMRARGHTGVWEIFIPRLSDGETYKFELIDAQGNLLPQKADPMGLGAEHPPKTGSIIRTLDNHDWTDANWMSKRGALHKIDQPISIYEVNLGSWRRVTDDNNRRLSYAELAASFIFLRKFMASKFSLPP